MTTLDWLKSTQIKYIVNVAHGNDIDKYEPDYQLLKGKLGLQYLGLYKSYKNVMHHIWKTYWLAFKLEDAIPQGTQ